MEKHYNSPRLRAKYKEMNNEPKIKTEIPDSPVFKRRNTLESCNKKLKRTSSSEEEDQTREKRSSRRLRRSSFQCFPVTNDSKSPQTHYPGLYLKVDPGCSPQAIFLPGVSASSSRSSRRAARLAQHSGMTSAAAASSADPVVTEVDDNNHHTVTIEIPQHVIQNGTVDVSMDSPGSQTSSSSEGPEGSAAAAAAAAVVAAGATAQASQVTTQVVVADTGVVTADCASPHYITVTVSDGDPNQADIVTAGGVHPTYVQYVEGSPEQAIYTATNGQMAYPVYTVGEATGTMYTSATAQYYPSNSTAVTYSQVANSLTQQGGSQSSPGSSAAAQLLAQSTAGYLIQQGVDAESAAHTLITTHRGASPPTVSADAPGVTYMVSTAGGGNGNGAASSAESVVAVAPGAGSPSDLDGSDPHPSLTHATRVSPATVQWLLENYETAEGVSLPRSTLYNHYQRHCSEHKLDPVNAASFGKLIRSVFLGLRTRRLGTRGNSKYHYYGIRVKPGSSLNQLGEDGNSPLAGRGSTGPQTTPGGSSATSQRRYKFLGSKSEAGNGQYDQTNSNPSHSSGQINCSPSQNSHHHQYLGDGVGAIPEFPEIALTSELALPEDCTLEDVDTLRSIYREHCEAFLDAVITLEFQTVESVWREFWRSQDNNNGEECEEEKYLSKTKLYQLCKCEPVQQFIRHVDYLFYQNLVEVLIPDVLRPIPSTLTQAIRNFAKGLESWLTSAMQGCPQEMMELKVCAVSSFAQTLRRYTSLNHLAQAARAVLQNSAQINQMLVDLNRVDFHNVQEQASWVCQCDDGVVQRLEEDFKVTLQQQNSLEQWAAWLKGVVTQVLKPYQGKPNFAKAARQFLLKWSFYSSMVIRDLTLRSAASFGSFHLIRLLYDEYMFFLIEHQVAQETGETPIAVMGEKLPTSTSSLFPPETVNGNSPSSSVTIKTEFNHAKRLKIS